MTQTKKYAIKCEYREQSQECTKKGFEAFRIPSIEPILVGDGYILISYKEAVEMGLLGKKTNDDINYMQSEVTTIVPSQIITSPCPNCGVVYQMGDDNKFHIIKGPNNDKLIEKIMEDIEELYIGEGYPRGYIEEILTKHFTPKKQELVEITPKELEELREKARKYDELCK